MNASLSKRIRALKKRALQADGTRRHAGRPTTYVDGEVIEGEAAWLLFNSAHRVCAVGNAITVAIGDPGAQRLAVFDARRQRLAVFNGDQLGEAARALFAESDLLDAALSLDDLEESTS